MIIDWIKISEKINLEIKEEVKNLDEKPCLCVVLVWDNPSSLRYIRQKHKLCDFVWINFKLEKLDEKISENELLEVIEKLNKDNSITWYMVQMPLPKHINEYKIINKIDPKKDADWFHIENQGKVLIWDNTWLIPCTPAWIIDIIKSIDDDISWKIVTVIWKSNIVWKPVVNLLINLWATVISCNSKTKNLEQFTKISDIIITATWKPWIINKNMIKENSIIIDVWFTVIDWKIFWDVADFEEINKIWNKITPVPWGVWPLTVTNLIKNTLKIYKNEKKI
jgi:methylenetetrahydrofolate dehydrogenase (NADP+)/methenyltetrahydrofolate cyclohydrolase